MHAGAYSLRNMQGGPVGGWAEDIVGAAGLPIGPTGPTLHNSMSPFQIIGRMRVSFILFNVGGAAASHPCYVCKLGGG